MYLNHFMQITLKANQASKSLQKLHTGSIFCFAGYPSLFWQFWGEGGWSNNIHASSARASWSRQTTHYSTQNYSPVPLFITNIVSVLKAHLRTSNSPITRSIKDIFDLKAKENTDLRELIDRRTAQHSLMVITTDQLLWRQKRISAVSTPLSLKRINPVMGMSQLPIYFYVIRNTFAFFKQSNCVLKRPLWECSNVCYVMCFLSFTYVVFLASINRSK